MMKWVFGGLILLSIVFGAFSGNMQQVSNAAIVECTKAVELVAKLLGSLCLWSGLMRVAQKSGLTHMISKILRPITKIIFKGLEAESPALRIISMNITANLLGLGNAATPLGIAAMQELDKTQPPEKKGIASNHMIMLVVLNTASIQLLPTTIALLRLEYGAANPMDVLPAILTASLVTVTFGVIAVKLFQLFEQRGAPSSRQLAIKARRSRAQEGKVGT